MWTEVEVTEIRIPIKGRYGSYLYRLDSKGAIRQTSMFFSDPPVIRFYHSPNIDVVASDLLSTSTFVEAFTSYASHSPLFVRSSDLDLNPGNWQTLGQTSPRALLQRASFRCPLYSDATKGRLRHVEGDVVESHAVLDASAGFQRVMVNGQLQTISAHCLKPSSCKQQVQAIAQHYSFILGESISEASVTIQPDGNEHHAALELVTIPHRNAIFTGVCRHHKEESNSPMLFVHFGDAALADYEAWGHRRYRDTYWDADQTRAFSQAIGNESFGQTGKSLETLLSMAQEQTGVPLVEVGEYPNFAIQEIVRDNALQSSYSRYAYYWKGLKFTGCTGVVDRANASVTTVGTHSVCVLPRSQFLSAPASVASDPKYDRTVYGIWPFQPAQPDRRISDAMHATAKAIKINDQDFGLRIQEIVSQKDAPYRVLETIPRNRVDGGGFLYKLCFADSEERCDTAADPGVIIAWWKPDNFVVGQIDAELSQLDREVLRFGIVPETVFFDNNHLGEFAGKPGVFVKHIPGIQGAAVSEDSRWKMLVFDYLFDVFDRGPLDYIALDDGRIAVLDNQKFATAWSGAWSGNGPENFVADMVSYRRRRMPRSVWLELVRVRNDSFGDKIRGWLETSQYMNRHAAFLHKEQQSTHEDALDAAVCLLSAKLAAMVEYPYLPNYAQTVELYESCGLWFYAT